MFETIDHAVVEVEEVAEYDYKEEEEVADLGISLEIDLIVAVVVFELILEFFH